MFRYFRVIVLALPARIIEMAATPGWAWVKLGGVRRQISVELVLEAEPGDYVIVHAGYGIGILKPEEAQRTLDLFEEMVRAAAPGEVPGLDGRGRPSASGS